MRDIKKKNHVKNWYEASYDGTSVQEYRQDPETKVSAMQIRHPKGELICSPKGEIVLIQNTTSATLLADVEALGKTNQCSIVPGGVFVIAPWSRTRIDLRRPLNLISVSIPVSFIAASSQMNLQEYQRRIAPLLMSSHMEPFCSQAMKSIWDELGNDKVHSRLLIGGTACVLLGSILRLVESLPERDPPLMQEREMVQVADSIETNLDEQVVLEDLAEICGMSLTNFQSAFKMTFGMTPKKYIVERRVFKARTLITQSKESFAGIATACGFYDQSHMIHTFKRQLGYTPGKLRESILLDVVR